MDNHTTHGAHVRCMTVFHDLAACPLAEDGDLHEVMRHVFFKLDDAASRANIGFQKQTSQMAQDWRCMKPQSTHLPAFYGEQMVDLGVSCMSVGRKAEAIGQKIRSDIAFFIESHADPMNHAIALLVSNASQYASEIRALERAGILCFVLTRSPAASPLPAATCISAGTWDDVVPNAGGQAPHAAMAPAPSIWSFSAGGTPLNEDTIAAAIQEATGWMPREPKGTPESPPAGAPGAQGGFSRHFFQPLPSMNVPATLESKGDDSTTTWRRGFSAPTDIHHTSARQRMPANKAKAPVTPPQRWARGPQGAGMGFGAKYSAEFVPGAAALAGSAVPTTTGGNGNAAAGTTTTTTTTGNDPYRIIFGALTKHHGDFFRITERSGRTHDIQTADLDFEYCWVDQLPELPGTKGHNNQHQGSPVCCRLHKSGRVTDIRMCGDVARIVRGEFGFIRHPLFPSNLYFRLADTDPSHNASTAANSSGASHGGLTVGSIVAFRVGRKSDRVWAMRVWQVPEGTFAVGSTQFVEAAAGAAAGATTSGQQQQRKSRRKAVGRHGKSGRQQSPNSKRGSRAHNQSKRPHNQFHHRNSHHHQHHLQTLAPAA